MASVFLSYVREDADKARAIAAALERSGNSVWWDARMKGGAEYSAEIEAALRAAEKVVVLWSERSVASAWVRDEAAAGRDRGRLVPVKLDGTQPPLGFRQFQTIDLARWKGGHRSALLRDLVLAIGDTRPLVAEPSVQNERSGRGMHMTSARRAFAAIVIVALAALAWWWAGHGQGGTPIVAIDSTGTHQSQEVARQLAVRLGDIHSGGRDAFRLIQGKGKADIVLQVDADDRGDVLNRGLSVLSGTDRSILWSTSLEQPASRRADLTQQLTITSERVLSCAVEALSQRKERIDPVTLKLYLTGCSQLQEVYGNGDYDPGLISLFQQVVSRAPHFESAWAKLLATESETARLPEMPPSVANNLRAEIAHVQKLGLRPGELYAAKASLVPQSDFARVLSLYDEGIRADPDNAFLYRLRSEAYQRVGRMIDAVFDAAQALKIDPLSPALQDSYMSALAYAGNIDSAYQQLRKSEAMWPNARNIQMARYRLDLRYGDPKEAMALFHGSPVALDPAQEAFLRARINPTAANIEQALNDERAVYAGEPRYIAGLIQALAHFGRTGEAIDVLLNYRRLDALGFNAEVLFRPDMRDVWRDPRSIRAAAHLGFVRYWSGSGHWPDFCSDPTLPYDCKKEAAKYS
jgi:tetratricopeptide (TPR) repeat protein